MSTSIGGAALPLGPVADDPLRSSSSAATATATTVVPHRQRRADRALGQQVHGRGRHDHDALALARLRRRTAELQLTPDLGVVRLGAREQQHHAPAPRSPPPTRPPGTSCPAARPPRSPSSPRRSPLIAARSRQRGGRSARQWRTSPTWLSVKPMNTPIANSGIRLLTCAPDATSSSTATQRQRDDPDPVDRLLGAQVEHVRQPVVLGQQAHQHRQPAEAGVRRQPQHQRDREVGDVERPAGAERRRRSPAPAPSRRRAARRDGRGSGRASPTSITPSRTPSRDLGPLGRPGPRLAERRHAVGDRLDAGDRRAAGRERLEDQDDPERLGDRGAARASRSRPARADARARARSPPGC